jgi:hypothetical protein
MLRSLAALKPRGERAAAFAEADQKPPAETDGTMTASARATNGDTEMEPAGLEPATFGVPRRRSSS